MVGSPPFSVVAGQWYRVTIDARTSQEGQPINVIIRRGGGGTAGKEQLIPAAESFAGSTAWRRYSFTFQSIKTVTAGDPATQELGARVNFERNMPGSALSVAKLELVKLIPAQVALQVKLLLNRNRAATSFDCSAIGIAPSACNAVVYFHDNTPVTWPATVAALSGSPVYTRDVSLIDSDGDGIADQQDYCPNTGTGSLVNSRGCAFVQ